MNLNSYAEFHIKRGEIMLDIAVSYNKYKFFGNEFLTWLWYIIDSDENLNELIEIKKKSIALEIGNSIVLENSLNDDSIEKISIKGNDAGFEEGRTALRKGAVVTEINLILKIDEKEFKFNIKGESLNLTGLKTPAAGKIENSDDIEGAVLEKIFLYNSVFEIIDSLFLFFIKKRTSEQWKNIDIHKIRDWVKL